MPERRLPSEPLEWGSVEPWPLDAPDLRPRGLILIESSLTFAGHPSEEHNEDVQQDTQDTWDGGFDWTVAGQPAHVTENGEWHAALIGDIFICREGWHLMVGAVLPIDGRPGVFDDCTDRDDVERRLGYWASHLLWDFLIVEGNRQLVNARTGFTLPSATPRPVLRHELPPIEPLQDSEEE